MKKHHQSKKRPLFDPDKIATTISRALSCDLGPLTHEYEGFPQTSGLIGIQNQIDQFLKKYQSTVYDKEKLEAETFSKFRKVNRHMKRVNIRLKSELACLPLRIQSSTSYMDKVHLRARALVHHVLSPFTEEEWLKECKNSQGSSIGVPYKDTSIERKFTFPLSVTEGCLNTFKRLMGHDRLLCQAIREFNESISIGDHFDVVGGSRATTVDKTQDKRRMICVEPTCNMYLQQGLMQMMYNRFKHFGLDVEVLPYRHKERARTSSLTLSESTIDWSSASDCVSIELLRFLLPPKWFGAIDQTRSSITSLAGRDIELGMIATMGNAVTFPLETLVFWAYGHAVRLSLQRGNGLFPEWEDLNLISVFGDDCIVPSAMAPQFIEALEHIGFIINDDKSFYGSYPFRESCGGDYYRGYDVRPYCVRAPQNRKMSSLEPWLYIICNSLFKKYMLYFGETSWIYDKNLLRYIFSIFRRYNLKAKVVPPYYPEDSGFVIPLGEFKRLRRHYRFKVSRVDRSKQGTYSFKYCRFQYRTYKKKDMFLRYATWLKRPTLTQGELHEFEKRDHRSFSIRRVGGYVVASGISGHWSD